MPKGIYPRNISGRLNPNWKGGEVKGPGGRVLVYCPHYAGPKVAKVYVLRYRLVMEKKLGRPLRSDEIVHHLNGKVDDDRPENIEAMTQSKHVSEHRADMVKANIAAHAERRTK